MDLMVATGSWLYQVPGASRWYYASDKTETVKVVHLVHTNVKLLDVGPSAMPPKAAKSTVKANNAKMIDSNTRLKILNTIQRRNAMEYDPSRVYVDGEVDSEAECKNDNCSDGDSDDDY